MYPKGKLAELMFVRHLKPYMAHRKHFPCLLNKLHKNTENGFFFSSNCIYPHKENHAWPVFLLLVIPGFFSPILFSKLLVIISSPGSWLFLVTRRKSRTYSSFVAINKTNISAGHFSSPRSCQEPVLVSESLGEAREFGPCFVDTIPTVHLLCSLKGRCLETKTTINKMWSPHDLLR